MVTTCTLLLYLREMLGISEWFPTRNKTGRSLSRMTGLRHNWEEDVPKCLGRYFSRNLQEISSSQEIPYGNADLY